jgi:Glyoxalase-like domain
MWKLYLAILILSTAVNTMAQKYSNPFVSRVDHLVYATPDLNRGIEEIEKLLGVKATPGGQHSGRGTRNALVELGPTAYLEIIATDPEQPTPTEPRSFGIDGLKQSKLVAWSMKAIDLAQLRNETIRKGVLYDEVRSGGRQRPDGIKLSWQVINPLVPEAEGVLPFFIDWGHSPHPADTAAKGATLLALRAEHPNVKSVSVMLKKLGIGLPVTHGPTPKLIAVIECPKGKVELKRQRRS